MSEMPTDAPRPLALAVVPRSCWTVMSAGGYAARRSLGALRSARMAAVVLVLLTLTAAYLWWQLLSPGAFALAVVAAVAAVLLLGGVVALAVLVVAAASRRRRVWTDATGSIVLTAKLAGRQGVEWRAANFSAAPRGHDRTTPFLIALCALADAEGATVRAIAGNHGLYRRLYAPRGFVVAEDRPRPRIVRYPSR